MNQDKFNQVNALLKQYEFEPFSYDACGQDRTEISYDLFFNDIIPEVIPPGFLMWIGHYHFIKCHYIKMMKCYMTELQDETMIGIVAYYIGLYHEKINDVENMKKYYMMSDEHGDRRAGIRLIKYYEKIGDIDNIISSYGASIYKSNYDVLDTLLGKYKKVLLENKQLKQQLNL
jgi:hypothetical protein